MAQETQEWGGGRRADGGPPAHQTALRVRFESATRCLKLQFSGSALSVFGRTSAGQTGLNGKIIPLAALAAAGLSCACSRQALPTWSVLAARHCTRLLAHCRSDRITLWWYIAGLGRWPLALALEVRSPGLRSPFQHSFLSLWGGHTCCGGYFWVILHVPEINSNCEQCPAVAAFGGRYCAPLRSWNWPPPMGGPARHLLLGGCGRQGMVADISHRRRVVGSCCAAPYAALPRPPKPFGSEFTVRHDV